MGLQQRLNQFLFDPADKLEKRLVSGLDRTLKNVARPIARDGLNGLRAGVANFIAPNTYRRPERSGHGYGSGTYSGMFQQWANAYRQLPGDPTGLALAAETSAYIYDCLMVRNNAIAGLKWDIYPKAGKRDSNTALRDTPFHRLIDYARTEYGHNLFFLWTLSKGVHGEVFFEKMVNDWGVPGGVRYLNRIAIDPFIMGGRVLRYTYSDDAGMHDLLPNQVFRNAYPNVLDDFSGSAPMSRALVAANIDRLLAKHILAYFVNGARIGGVLTARQGANISQQDWDIREKEFREMLGGPENAYKTAVIPFELEYTSYNNQPFDHQGDLEESSIKKIHAAFGVPTALTGVITAGDPLSSLGTLDAAKAFFYERWVQPEALDIAQSVNTEWLPWLGMHGYELVFDVDKVLSTMRQTTERSTRIRSDYESGLITFNQAQTQLGYDEVPDGDFYIMRPGVVVVKADQLASVGALLQPPPALAFPPPFGLPTVPATQSVTPPTDPTKDAAPAAPVGKKMSVVLSLANQPDLIQFQNRVKELVEGQCQWNEPGNFRITLLVAPAATDKQAASVKAALEQLDVPEFNLHVGSLGVFDHVGQFVVHFKLRSPNDLRDFQQQVYDVCQQAGVATSSFHNPAAYTPHITMGYAADKLKPIVYSSTLRVQPDALTLSYGNEVLLTRGCGGDDEPEPPAGKASFDKEFDPDQPRDDQGEWTDTGASAGGDADDNKPQNENGNDRSQKWEDRKTVNKRNSYGDQSVDERDFENATGINSDKLISLSGGDEINLEKFANAEVNVEMGMRGSRYAATVTMNSSDESIEMDRLFLFNDDGTPDVIENRHFFIDEDLSGKGEGTKIFKSQVDTAADSGFREIQTLAGRGRTLDGTEMNGYYTWARLGYDGEVRFNSRHLDEFPVPDIVHFHASEDDNGNPVLSVSNFMRSQEGRNYWKEHGIQMEMSFDLESGSDSRAVLNAYYSKKFGGASD